MKNNSIHFSRKSYSSIADLQLTFQNSDTDSKQGRRQHENTEGCNKGTGSQQVLQARFVVIIKFHYSRVTTKCVYLLLGFVA